jgi:uncharacterized protein YegJ (DUF2314 family)
MKTMASGLALVLLLLCACGNSADRDKDSATGAIPKGDLRAKTIAFELAIYYLPRPLKAPLAELDRHVSDKQAVFKRVEELREQEQSPRLTARVETNPRANYAPPEPDFLERFGHGLKATQTEALQVTQSALILDFAYPQEHVWSGLRAALNLAHDVAKATGGLLWDETTREVFTPEAWAAQRITSWTEAVPEISRYTVIHSYSSGDYVRSITLGMEKFGLPDIVIDKSPRSLERNVGHIINMFAQTISEGAVLQDSGEFDLRFRSIKHPAVRDVQLKELKDKATGIARLSLRTGRWEEGDPKNRLIEITFDRGTGPDVNARQNQILSEAFGWEDSIVDVDPDEKLLEASERARSKLSGFRAAFNKGFRPGEFILVKAPFDTPDGGHEWMWVEVVSWKGSRISGSLQNEPFNIPTLRAGQRVEVLEEDVFDYIFTRADGTTEGNETGNIIEAQSER